MGAGIAVGIMVFLLMCGGLVYKSLKAGCEERGGHIEVSWGVSHSCEGARR